MTDAYVEFLCKIASNVIQFDDTAHNVLRSHYLMKCKAATGGYSLPANKFSTAVRCPKCCLERTKDSPVTLQPNMLSKRQRKRLNSRKGKIRKTKLEYTMRILHGNKLEHTCYFCHHTAVTHIEKPKMDSVEIENPQNINTTVKKKEENVSKHTMTEKIKDKTGKNNAIKTIARENNKTNLYTNAFDVFSLNNEKNTLKSSVQEPPKVIKNSKRKKDKYAGLCQKAVLASVKLKEEKVKQNKLNLFLKPSLNS